MKWGALSRPRLCVETEDLIHTSYFESLCLSFQDLKGVNFSERQLQSKVLPSPRTRYCGVKQEGK